jgi:hypothetical protein
MGENTLLQAIFYYMYKSLFNNPSCPLYHCLKEKHT